MPEEPKIDLGTLEETISLIVIKKEDPSNRDLSFFGWDGRHELAGKKGAIFDDFHGAVSMLRYLGLKDIYWNVTYRFFDFDQLLTLYPYAKCILDILESYRHRTDVQDLKTQIKELKDAITFAQKQTKDIEKDTFNRVLTCIK